ncbi:hypothetical protein [Cryptosporangium sp. NPDC048952]|uniref:hypothetical protein n=1 Tax=Cryptosporangium sp. NPDC048952 TaxID=3363961 RepID=UPI00371507BC
MTLTTLVDIALGLALLAYLSTRQLRWAPVDTARMWRLPIVLGAIGLASIAATDKPLTTADVAVLVVSGLLAVGSGVAMGSLARFRPIPAGATPKRMRNGELPDVESRTGWVGVALWLGLIVARIGLDVVGSHLGASLATGAGVILLVLAVNRAVRARVVTGRIATARVKMVA